MWEGVDGYEDAHAIFLFQSRIEFSIIIHIPCAAPPTAFFVHDEKKIYRVDYKRGALVTTIPPRTRTPLVIFKGRARGRERLPVDAGVR